MENIKMETTDANEDDLFLQIRTAHRLLAAYYQRVLPTIESMAQALDLKFYGWIPSQHNAPRQFSGNVFNHWQWDLLPANCTHYVFYNAEKKDELEVGKYMVVFHLISDSGILQENLQQTKSQTDGLELPMSAEKAKSVLRVQLYTPYENRKGHWHDGLFAKCETPRFTAEPEAQKVDKNVNAYISGFEIPLTELICENSVDDIIKRIEKYRDQLISSAIADKL
jgi:hypothetical protein